MQNKSFAIVNGKVLDSEKKAFFEKNILVSEGKIEKICASDIPECTDIIDAKGKYVIPGLIDMHTHGALGIDMPEAYHFSTDDICRLMREHYVHYGVTTVFPTYITVTLDELKKASENIYAASVSDDNPVNIFGIHSEGVFLSHEKKGAHDETLLREPDIDEIDYIFSGFTGGKHVLSIAPEIKNSLEVIRKATEKGYVVSAAHTNATAEQTRKGLEAGVKSFTHLYNGMRSFSHRDPGVVGVALASDAYVELICDGFHVHPEAIALTRKAKGSDKVILITDSVLPAGLPDGEYIEGTLKKIVKDSNIYLENGTIAGSSLNLFKGVKNYMRFTGADLAEAVVCASANPAKLTGIYDITGSLDEGKQADFVILDENTNIEDVYVKGVKRFTNLA